MAQVVGIIFFGHSLVPERPPVITSSRFRKAANRVTQSAAFYAVNKTMPSINTTTTEIRPQNFLMGNPPGQKLSTAPYALQTVNQFASISTSAASPLSALILTAHGHTSAHSAAPGPTMPSPGSADRDLLRPPTAINSPSSLTNSQFLSYRDFSNTIVHRDSHIIADNFSLQHYNDIYYRTIHPYDTDAFHHFILKHDLTLFYSLLVTNLKNGFPLGVMPPITDTIIFKNHPSAFIHSDVVDKYLTDELDAHCMSGPFSRLQVENILRGAFLCSPLLVSVQTQQPGTPDKLRVCRHLSKATFPQKVLMCPSKRMLSISG